MIAFAYCDTLTSLKPIYRALAEGLVENASKVMPGERILHIADDETDPIKGCDVLRVPRKVGLMSWRLVAHYCAQSLNPEILFTEPDVRFRENVMDVFKQQFDVTVTGREWITTMKGEIVPEFTLGANFSRSADFWKDAAKVCLKLDRKAQLWGGDMVGLAAAVHGGKYNVLTLPAETYNHVPNKPDDGSQAKIVHYKGKRKDWLFPVIQEAA